MIRINSVLLALKLKQSQEIERMSTKIHRCSERGGVVCEEMDPQNAFIEKYHFYYLHIPHNIFSLYFKTMKFNKLKYHLIFLRPARVQGFEGFGSSNLLQSRFIQGN